MLNIATEDVLKVPLLLVAAFAGHTALTSPTATPHTYEQERLYGDNEQDAVTKMLWTLPVVKAVLWLATFCETIAVLSQYFPELTNISSVICPAEGGPLRIALSNIFFIGWGLAVSGAALRGWCFRELGRHFTFHLSLRDNHKLVTSGPYALVRHPAYSGHVAYTVGSMVYLLGSGSWMRECGVLHIGSGKSLVSATGLLLLAVSSIFKRAVLEDRALREEFKGKWEEYAKRTPYRMIPYLF
ncbi:hypothetical protein OBBRIDRAFT_796998 [Obba rivulosa]|uniref:Protein-S-isoprenylcysteine O-methyltransferase n=1 Tax=Obba rivulosa TaxID=1052685 RepID=A0A8E2ANQ0_9APHY|nr:hypothetical protein OBBRIDRAFT_796998 [Obba rivulosa]